MAADININYNAKWTGYKNFGDIANMSITDLIAGSQNCFVTDGRKLEPRAGMGFLGDPGTEIANTDPYWSPAGRIHSSYDSFVNNQGLTIPVRVFYSGTLAQGDIMEAWLPVNGDVNSNVKNWFQITGTSPTTPLISAHRYFFSSGWYDPQNIQNQLVFVYGATGSGTNYVTAWSGGFAPVINVTGTTIQTNTTWSKKGFIAPPEGPATVVVNGIEYALTSGDFSTDTITVASTTGINIGDLAFQAMQFDTMPGTFTPDVCSLINNQVYYIDWNSRDVYISWAKNRDAFITPIIYSGSSGLNDAFFSGTYTGTTTSTFQVSIDSVAPNEQIFVGTGANDAIYITSGYSLPETHIFNFVIVADFEIVYDTGGGGFTTGEIIQGATPNDQVKVFWDDTGNHRLALTYVSGNFQPGDTITGDSSGATATISAGPFSVFFIGWYQFFQDGTLLYQPPGTASELQLGPISLVPTGLSINFSSINSNNVGDYFQLTIGLNDTFTWSLNGVTQASGLPVALTNTFLADGISVSFSAVRGHTTDDTWLITGYPRVVRGWRDFYFTTPNRQPSEGAKISLDSNGWTMAPQEDTMYLNAKAGHYYTMQFKTSADLLAETVYPQRLKTEAQNKVLFPYLIKYAKNQLATISQDKTYDILGRQKFLELPQTKSISDWVRIDFETADWEDGDVVYFKRKIYFSVPKMGYLFVWDDFMKYWHPPQRFSRRIAQLSIIDNQLCGQSYERNETYVLFTGTNDLGLYPIDTRMVFAYDGSGRRMSEKSVSNIGMEGYVAGNPQIKWQINSGIGGCGGTPNGIIRPFTCVPKDTASLGKSSLGFHGLGNSVVTPSQYFNYIRPFPNILYYLRNMQLSCSSFDQRWAIISIGTDVSYNNINNSSIVDTTIS